MITKKTLYFDKVDDKMFLEIAKEIDNGFTVTHIQSSSATCAKCKMPDDYITVELLNVRESIGF